MKNQKFSNIPEATAFHQKLKSNLHEVDSGKTKWLQKKADKDDHADKPLDQDMAALSQ
jgi:hypothetical protein